MSIFKEKYRIENRIFETKDTLVLKNSVVFNVYC